MTQSPSPSALASSRADRLATELAADGIDFLLVTYPVNVRYLTGFTGSNGLALIGAGEDGVRRLLTDFRYATQSAEQVPDAFEREIVPQDLIESAGRSLAEGGSGRLGFDDAHLSVKAHSRLHELLSSGWELIPCGGAVERLREVKDDAELARIRDAAQLIDDVLGWLADRGLAGRSEREVAFEVEHEMRVRGAQTPSFPTIVAAGEHGALPHAEPRDVEIARGVLVTIDLGAQVDGYCSDCTRTFATGEPSARAREVYEIVLRAQEAGLEAVTAGLTGREVDAVARAIIVEAGFGEQFGHGLGHGVGLEVHEGPRLSRQNADQPLRAGNVVTVEPGIYLPGELGVRIEDLVAVTEDGRERLSAYPKELLVID